MSLHAALSSIINGRQNVCTLCLKITNDEMIRFQDFIAIKGIQNPVKMSKILYFVLGKQILQTVSSNEAVCQQCKTLSINCYTFIKMCKENLKSLNNTVNTLMNQLENIVFLDCKTVFITINTTDCSDQTYYDYKKSVHKRSVVFKRLKSLMNKKESRYCYNNDIDFEPDYETIPKVKSKTATKRVIKQLKVRKKTETNSVVIPTSDMMCDTENFKCKVCLKVYPTAQNLRQHYIRVHAPKEFKCTDCPRSYGSESLLQQHKYDSHCPAICSQCGKTYLNRHSLKMHELGHKTKLVCQACGRSYKTKKTYAKHIQNNMCQQKEKRSNAQATFTCDYCNKKFCNKPTLRVHIQFEHGNSKAFNCMWCNKRFNAQSRLNAHIVKHTQEKKFWCEICGGKFVTKESLLYHTRIHTGERPYKCELCDKRFLSTSRRAEHVRRHHMGPNLECEICHSKFKGRSCLTRHKKRHFDPKSRLHCSNKETENGGT